MLQKHAATKKINPVEKDFMALSLTKNPDTTRPIDFLARWSYWNSDEVEEQPLQNSTEKYSYT
jgi:hypothetical protein